MTESAPPSAARRWAQRLLGAAVVLFLLAELGVELGTRSSESGWSLDRGTYLPRDDEPTLRFDSVAVLQLDGSGVTSAIAKQVANGLRGAAPDAEVTVLPAFDGPYAAEGVLADLIVLVETRRHDGFWALLGSRDRVEVAVALARSPRHGMDMSDSPLAAMDVELSGGFTTRYLGLQGHRARTDDLAKLAAEPLVSKLGEIRILPGEEGGAGDRATGEVGIPEALTGGARVLYRGHREDGSYEVLRTIDSPEGTRFVERAIQALEGAGWDTSRRRTGVHGAPLACFARRDGDEVQVFQAYDQSRVREDPYRPDVMAILTRRVASGSDSAAAPTGEDAPPDDR